MKGAAENNILKWPGGRLDFSTGCILMGILNVTPDSFSDGGRFFDTDKALEHGLKMAADGAAIIDVGPESTRPGAEPASVDEQIRRAVPVIEALSKKVTVTISIDTYRTEVAEAALEAGAAMINDITALSDERMRELAAAEVLQFLLDRAKRAEQFGIPKERIFIDPGIGFGKTLEHNLLILKNVDRFVAAGYRVLIGTSRKSFIGRLTGKENPADRIFGTAATVALCAAAGVSILRVHDVAEMVDVVKVAGKLKI